MAIVSGLAFSGIRSLEIGAGDPKLPFKNHNHDAHTFSKFQRGTASVLGKLQYPKVRIPYLHLRHQRRTHILSAGRNYQLNYNDDSHTEPLWLNLIREAIWTTRSLFLFLVEQPSQLKYIEWPSFQSTLFHRFSYVLPEDSYSDSCSCCIAYCCAVLSRFSLVLSAGFDFEEKGMSSGMMLREMYPKWFMILKDKATQYKKELKHSLVSMIGIAMGLRLTTGPALYTLSFRAFTKTTFYVNKKMPDALAAREVIVLALQQGWPTIMIEGDCAPLLAKLSSAGPDFSAVGTIVTILDHLLLLLIVARPFSLIN
ncbi:UNVERIFIED_CONTAM: hypothetical protein Sradi_0570500 [Sesamum radiatum]|uniref:RNase H type-1 domain-containing protein n=1 Tax=Sesamum radiatum TaxID=300843 RepID=A0AAW2VJE3_SESRA